MKLNSYILFGLLFAAFFSFRAFAQPGAEGQTKPETPGDKSKEKPLPLPEVIKRLSENYRNIKTYKAEFRQELVSTSQGRVISRGQGEVLYKKPGKMVWKYEEPEEHYYITHGNTIWDYSPSDKEVYVIPVRDALYKSFLLGLGELEEEFEISFHAGSPRNKEGLYQLDLVPKERAERESLGTITLYLDPEDFTVKQTVMTDPLGNRNRIEFLNQEKNLELDDKQFEFKAPPGVKVIRAEELSPGN